MTLLPVADATLLSIEPDHSMGGEQWITAGTTQNGTSNRAVLKFDVAASLPAGSRIVDVGLILTLLREPADGTAESLFSLRRMLMPWGEGSTRGPFDHPGFGAPATPGDATWNHRFAGGTERWATGGGMEGRDFSAELSGLRLVYGRSDSPYSFEMEPQAIQDVQLWLDRPHVNFGWMLKSEAETTRFTARGFGSRELNDDEASPRLVITYVRPPRINTIRLNGDRVALEISITDGTSYRVETASSIDGPWALLTVLTATYTGEFTVQETSPPAPRFYRVGAQ